MWALWHVDRYFVGILFMGVFIIVTTSFSIIMSMVLKDTRNNIIVSTLLHTSFNLSFEIFFSDSFTETKIVILVALVLLVGAIISIVVNKDYFLGRKNIK
jgi:membrane protease YdiL (CAAX protease family)